MTATRSAIALRASSCRTECEGTDLQGPDLLLGAASILRTLNHRVLVFGGPHYADSCFQFLESQLRAAAPKRALCPPRHAVGQWDTGCPCITMAVAGPHVDLCVPS